MSEGFGVYRITGSVEPMSSSPFRLDADGGVNAIRRDQKELYNRLLLGELGEITFSSSSFFVSGGYEPGPPDEATPEYDQMTFSDPVMFFNDVTPLTQTAQVVFRPNFDIFGGWSQISGTISFAGQGVSGEGADPDARAEVSLYIGNHGDTGLNDSYRGDQNGGSFPGSPDATLLVYAFDSAQIYSADFSISNTFSGSIPIIVTILAAGETPYSEVRLSSLTITVFGTGSLS